ncbi:MAG: hypothetical protein N2Z20_03420 [Elusimicrobiales bacterium]|nr:hypothetical protein [Elusimicrobiales bacterium]
MFKNIFITSCLIMMITIQSYSETNLKDPNKVIEKLAEMDSLIDKMIIEGNIEQQKLNIQLIRNDLEKIFLNKVNLTKQQAKIIWMYSGKIYLKVKRHLSIQNDNFRFAPSDNDYISITAELKKNFAISKWIYLAHKSKDSK